MMFELIGVTKTYNRREGSVVAFSAPRLKIETGEYVAVVGPSGSGKTTLLSLLGGMLSPTTGDVQFQGESLFALTAAQRAELRRKHIGFVFQTFNLVPYLTALENVEMPLYLAGKNLSEQKARASELLTQFGLGDRLHHKPRELSTGQQQRVALARTLANDPPLILADEPTGNLDPASRSIVLDAFDAFHKEGRTILMVTHDVAAASRAGRTLTIQGGQLIEKSPLRVSA